MKKKCICGCETFKIETFDSCVDCSYNHGIYEDGTFEYDLEVIKELDLPRSNEEYNECKLDSNWDNGCYRFTCTSCGKESILGLIYE